MNGLMQLLNGKEHAKSQCVTGFTQTRIYSPFLFAEQPITGKINADMLELFLEPQLVAEGIPRTVVFQ